MKLFTPLLLVALAAAKPSDDWTKLQPRNIFKTLDLADEPTPYDGDDWTDLAPKDGGILGPAPSGLLPADRVTADVCSVSQISDTSGTVTSPRHPGRYPANARCRTTIQAPEGSTVTLTCTSFSTQSCRRRYRDFLLINVDGQWSRDQTYIACGDLSSQTPFSVTSTGNVMNLFFRSDRRRSSTGFSCDYQIDNGSSSSGNSEGSSSSGGSSSSSGGGGGGGGSSDGTCGVSSTSSRIVGGERAEIEEYPWMAGLQLCRGTSCWFCGGSLISDRWVLTAAHCTDGATSANVRLGGTLVNSPSVSLTSTQLNTHPNYNSQRILNDIALIQLPSAVSFSDKIRPVCLPRQSTHAGQTFAGVSAQVSGWGRFSDSSNSISDFLRDVTAPIIANSACSWSPPSTQMCINTAGGKSSCNGDSGGPLQVRQQDGSFMEVGVVSYGSASGCEVGADAAFTRVTSFLSYITSVTGIDLS